MARTTMRLRLQGREISMRKEVDDAENMVHEEGGAMKEGPEEM